MTDIIHVDFKRKMRMGEQVQRGECKLKYKGALYSDDYDLCAAFYDTKTKAVGILNSDDSSELEKFIALAKSIGIDRIEILTKKAEKIEPIENLLSYKEIAYKMTFAGSDCYFVVEPTGIRFGGNRLEVAKSANRAPHIGDFDRFNPSY